MADLSPRQPMRDDGRPSGGSRLVRLWPLFALAALCGLATTAGVAAAIWLGRVAPAIRIPASEPGRTIFAPPRTATYRSSLPVYQPGDTFEFTVREPSSVGEPVALERRFRVDAIRGDRIDWSVGRSTMTTTLNPLAPAIKWRATEEGEGSRQLLGDPLALFPLEKGKKSSLRSIGGGGGGGGVGGFRDLWECESAGIDLVTVAAGSFRSWRIECENRSGSSKETYYYSDEIGFWVSRISKTQRGSEPVERVYELTASSRLKR